MTQFLRKILALLKPYRTRTFLGVVMGLLAGLAEPLLLLTVVLVFMVVFPESSSPEIEERMQSVQAFLHKYLPFMENSFAGLKGADTRSTAASVFFISLIPLVMLLRGALGYLNLYLMYWVSFRAINDLRERIFRHLISLPMSFFAKNSSGELMSRLSNDLGAIQTVMGSSLITVIKDPVTVVTFLVLLFSQHRQLTLVSMMVFPIIIVPILVFGRKLRKSTIATQKHYGEVVETMQETFTGIRAVKAYNLEGTLGDVFAHTQKKMFGQIMRVARSSELPGPLTELVGSIGVAVLIGYVAFRERAAASALDFFSFVLMIFMMYRPLKSLVRLASQLQQARAASQRVFELLELKTSLPEPAHPKPLHAANAEIRFENIRFSYGDRTILHGLNLTVKPGQFVALVGPTGSGKTSLTSLLLRFYDPDQGRITIGGVDLRDVRSTELREQIAVVTQEIILFNDTIRRNIGLGRPGATAQEIEDAAKAAYAHEFILQKPQGYDTVIGERGQSLSGGQRQRLAIARALVRNSPILILDEATSALDAEVERAVQAALETRMKGRTTLCIAHRLSTIQSADVIVVMDQGRIVETGSHAELLAKDGLYRKLHDLSFQSQGPSGSIEPPTPNNGL
jgi:subfamily B ATP-binding cassette protein MsbA